MFSSNFIWFLYKIIWLFAYSKISWTSSWNFVNKLMRRLFWANVWGGVSEYIRYPSLNHSLRLCWIMLDHKAIFHVKVKLDWKACYLNFVLLSATRQWTVALAATKIWILASSNHHSKLPWLISSHASPPDVRGRSVLLP